MCFISFGNVFMNIIRCYVYFRLIIWKLTGIVAYCLLLSFLMTFYHKEIF